MGAKAENDLWILVPWSTSAFRLHLGTINNLEKIVCMLAPKITVDSASLLDTEEATSSPGVCTFLLLPWNEGLQPQPNDKRFVSFLKQANG